MLAKKKVGIYAVEAGRGHRAAVAAFWSQLAERTKVLKVREKQLPLVCFFSTSPLSSCIRFVLTLISLALLHPTLRGGPRKVKRLQIKGWGKRTQNLNSIKLVNNAVILKITQI